MREEQERAFAGTGFVGLMKKWGLYVVLALLAGVGAFGFSRALKRRKLTTVPEALPQ